MTIWVGPQHGLNTQCSACTGNVLDDDRLFERFRQPFGDKPAGLVKDAAGRGRCDYAQRFARGQFCGVRGQGPAQCDPGQGTAGGADEYGDFHDGFLPDMRLPKKRSLNVDMTASRTISSVWRTILL